MSENGQYLKAEQTGGGTIVSSYYDASSANLYAGRVAHRIKKLLERHVKANGYETDAVLSKREGTCGLGISDDGSSSETILSVPVKIIVTSHDQEMFPMKLGDNPECILDFIWLPNYRADDAESGLLEAEVLEGMTISYLGNDYTVTIASPICLGGSLIIKECRANMVR